MTTEISFGAWVRRRRKSMDLTQQQLAQRLGCSISLIFKIEADERRPSRQIADLLVKHLEIPEEQRELFLRVARQERTIDHLEEASSPTSPQAGAASTNIQPGLPNPLTAIIGREHELRAIVQQLESPACRLLTLTGPGGIGKTHLSLEVAHQMKNMYSDGVCFVSLVGTGTAEFIVPAIAEALGVSFSGAFELKNQLFNYLKDRHMLIVLDNLEHLLNGVELLDELLERAPRVKLLTTSREQLNLHAEWIFEVQGFPLPVGLQFESADSNSAVAFFVQRAKQTHSDFNLTPDNLPYVERICQLVEGLPLGLELAAAWMRVLSVEEVAHEIERSMDFLTTSTRDLPHRHRSMRAVFDYSWNLLSSEEQNVLRRLSVFKGGFQRAAAEQVAGANLRLLSSLVSKSLIHRHTAQAGRYHQHELVRQFAASYLMKDVPKDMAVRSRHAEYYLAFWYDSENQLQSARQREILSELMADINNFRAAWDQAMAQNQWELLGQALRVLLLVYDLRGWHTEGVERLRPIVQALESDPDPHRKNGNVLGTALSFLGWFHFRRGQLLEARQFLERGLAILRTRSEKQGLAEALTLLAPVFTSLGEGKQALANVSEALEVARAGGDKWHEAYALMMQGGILSGWGEYDQAYASSEEALKQFRLIGDIRLIIVTLNTLGFVSLRSARYAEAREFLKESLALITPADDPWTAATAYGNLGIVELAEKNYAEARDLFQKSIPIFTNLGMNGDVAFYLTYLGETCAAMGATKEAEGHWLNAIHIAHETQAVPTILANLMRLAQLYAERGDIARAYEWTTQILSHPSAWEETKSRATKFSAELGSQLSSQQIQDAQADAKSKALEAIVHELGMS
ncbi:MAG TPA: tetratricopeptide repeat protein [Anaerolineales bacterium]|nr:tetratricopeptide repeat protein [Anaerolineales bacterium]